MSSVPHFDLVVLGGGPAGVTAALRARELGASVAIVERDRLGGTCTDDGCAPTRVLARAARILRDGEELATFGLSGEPATVDLPLLLQHAQRTVYQLHEKKQLAGYLAAQGAEVFENAGQARFAGPSTIILGDGRRLTADRALICVGGHARRLGFLGAELALTHSDVWSMTRLPRRLAVVGAAATGTQLASIFAAFGSEVTLLELAPRILPGEDPLVSSVMLDGFTRRRIRVQTGIRGIERLERGPGGLELRVVGQSTPLQTDAVIAAVGWPGNVEDLGLEAAGVATARGHIVTDDALRTSAQHIFAAGDVTGRMMLVQSATHEARVAVENALTGGARPVAHPIVPHGGFTDPEYASVGPTDTGESAIVGYDELDRAVIDGRTNGFAKLVIDPATRRVHGACVVGEEAVEVVQVVAAAMAAEMTVDGLAELELAYPTYAAIIGLAARRLGARIGSAAESGWHAISPASAAEWERRSA